jgi:Tfp pilus assembly protein PilF
MQLCLIKGATRHLVKGALLLFALASVACAAPRTPSNEAEVLERLPLRPADSTARELATLRATARQMPTNAGAVAPLAQRYFELAAARGDPRYLGYAEAVLQPLYAAPTAEVHLVRGQLRQYRHDFDGALADFAAALALNPDLASAHAWRAAIYLVRMDNAAARKECTALQNLKRNTLSGGCLGLAQAYSGQMPSAYATLAQALTGASDPDNRLWLLTRIAEVAAWQGQPVLAERHYREALAIGRDDVYLLAAWADFLLDNGRPNEVVKWLADWSASDSLLLRLTEAETALKLPLAPRHQQAMADRFAAAQARGDTTHRAEEARFQLHLRGDTAKALQLASANYQVQREPRDARVLLEAAIAARDSVAAQGVRDWLRTSGFEDPRLRQLGQASAQPGTAPTPPVKTP